MHKLEKLDPFIVRKVNDFNSDTSYSLHSLIKLKTLRYNKKQVRTKCILKFLIIMQKKDGYACPKIDDFSKASTWSKSLRDKVKIKYLRGFPLYTWETYAMDNNNSLLTPNPPKVATLVTPMIE